MRWSRFRNPVLVLALTIGGALMFSVSNRGPQTAEAAGQVAQPKTVGKSPSAPKQTTPNNSDAAGVRKAVADYVAALNKGDLNGVMAFWTPDAEYVAESGTATHGKKGIADLFKEVLPQFKGHKVTAEVKSVRMLHSDVALEEGSLTFTDGDGVRDESNYSAVWVKSDGKWLIASARDLPNEATATGPSVGYEHLRPLEWLVGDWVEDSSKAAVGMNCHWGPNKAFLLMHYEIKRDGQEPLDIGERLGWDPLNGIVRSWVFDSQGGFGEGSWTRNGKKWEVDCSGVLPDGGTGAASNTWEYVDGKTFVWRSTDRMIDDQPIDDMEIRFVRKAQATPEAKP
jgi:uncharacterized protein (TIGR02246 family)